MIIVTGGAGFIGTNLVRSLIESDKQILIIEELDRYTKKFENIKNLEILDCLDHNIFLKDLLNGKYVNKIDQIFSVAGGGDTFALINKINILDNFNFVSTAGGAFLEYLEGKELPGIKALN